MSDAFTRHLQREHKAVRQFTGLLRQEQALLAQTPVPVADLSHLTEEKTTLAGQLEVLDQQRRNLLVERGYSADRSGAEQLSDALGQTEQWHAFLVSVDEARTQNRINGLAIDSKLALSEKRLAFLQKAAADSLYDPTGRKRGFGDQSIHSKA